MKNENKSDTNVRQIRDKSAKKTTEIKYAGCVALLAECHLHLSNSLEKEELQEMIRLAIGDWCDERGWTMEQTFDRIELLPPTKQ